MKINYKKIILWILFIIVLINLISTPNIYYVIPENTLPKFYIHHNLFSDFIKYFLAHPLIFIISFIYAGIPLFFSIPVAYLLFPILQLIPNNFAILFIILWLILNFTIIIYLYKKLNIPRITFIKIIIYPIILNCGLFMILLEYVIPPSISYLISLLLSISTIAYPLYLIGSWLSKLKPIK